MKSKTLLDSAVFQLTPTRTRCDLYIIANDKKEKIASGLLNPFIAHLKAAQDQIAEGGYSILLAPEAGSNATWFTKCTVESFVRFVSTPEILERVYTIESEILQIEEAISIQGNNEILIEDQHIKPVAGGEGSKPTYDDDEEKAIVLYKPGAPELTGSSANEKNSKVQLLNVLETRKTVLKKEQGMAFARAVAAGFVIEHVSNLLSFAKCFGALRLMSACLRFMDLWKQKHESGQWVEIEAEDAMCSKSDYSPMNNASGIVLSTMTNRHDEPGGDAVSETKETPGSDPNASGGQQQYNTGQFLHPGFPPWTMHSSPSGAVPVYHQAYPMPYYQHYPSSAPFYPPPAATLPMDYRYPDPESNEETSEQHKNAGKSKSGRVVIRNINFINSKTKQKSSSGDESDTGDETESHNTLPKKKGNVKETESEGRNGKETDGGHWDAFQTYLLKVAAEGERSANEDMYSMEKDHNKKARRKSLTVDPLVAHHVGHDDDDADGEEHIIGLQSYDRNGRKIVYKSGNDDLKVCRAEEQKAADVRNPLVNSGFEGRSGLRNATDDEAAMVSLRSTSGVNESLNGGLNIGCYDLPSQNPENCFSNERLKYEPDALSLMPERDLEKRHMHIGGYDPALEYETQLACGKAQHKKGSKSAEKHQQSKGVGPPIIRKGKPSKVNNILEDARARADKLRSFKADLQKMKKQQQEAEHKRLEALKMERQKRIAARTNSNSSSSKKQLPSKQHSPISYSKGSKFSDSEPGTSSPLQRSKIKPTSTTNSKKTSTYSRLTKSMSSISDTKKDINSVTPDSKSARITRPSQSQPKKINSNYTATTTNTTKIRSAVSKPKSSNDTKSKSSAIMDLHQSKSATLPELKIFRTSSNLTQKVKVDKSVSQVAKQSSNERSLHQSDNDDNPIIDKSVVMLQHKQQSIFSANTAATLTNTNHGPEGAYIHEVSLPMEIVDKGTISVQPPKHPTTYEFGQEQVKKNSVADNSGTSSIDQAPYARVSSFEDPSTRNSEYAKAPRSNSGMVSGTEKAYISDFNNFKLEKIPELLLEKPQRTGFRRLLKLGKKSHTQSDTSTGNASQPDNAPLSAQAVHTLKTLISEDQTSQKPTRHFSLLSTFRGKTTEKKPTTFGS